MLAGVCVGTNNLARAGQFYDQVLSTIGMVRLMQSDIEIGYGPEGGDSCFWVLEPFDGLRATQGNGTQVIFAAANTDQVISFHSVALEQGGENEGAPGPREYRDGYYGAYCRDLDGNKLHVYHEILPE